MSATPATCRTADLDRLLADAVAWNRYAERMNAKVLAAGLVTAEELARDRQACQAALTRLRGLNRAAY